MPKVSKTHFVIAAIGAIGAIAYINSAKSIGLSCESTYTVVAYLFKGAEPYKSTSHGTTILQLSSNTWRYISMDGRPFQQMMEEAAKAAGKPFHASDLDHPIKTTTEAYTLFDINREEVEPGRDGEYRKHRSGVIDRLTGTINMYENTVQDNNDGYSWTTTQVGKCTPITIQTNL